MTAPDWQVQALGFPLGSARTTVPLAAALGAAALQQEGKMAAGRDLALQNGPGKCRRGGAATGQSLFTAGGDERGCLATWHGNWQLLWTGARFCRGTDILF